MNAYSLHSFKGSRIASSSWLRVEVIPASTSMTASILNTREKVFLTSNDVAVFFYRPITLSGVPLPYYPSNPLVSLSMTIGFIY